MLDKKWGYENFVNYNGYQPPFTTIQPDTLICRRRRSRGAQPSSRHRGDVHEARTCRASCTTDVDDLWLDAWDQIQAGS